jgi:hypothetical protein
LDGWRAALPTGHVRDANEATTSRPAAMHCAVYSGKGWAGGKLAELVF